MDVATAASEMERRIIVVAGLSDKQGVKERNSVMIVGDKVRCISEDNLSHREGIIIEIRQGLAELFIVRFSGVIYEQSFIFHRHELEKIRNK